MKSVVTLFETQTVVEIREASSLYCLKKHFVALLETVSLP